MPYTWWASFSTSVPRLGLVGQSPTRKTVYALNTGEKVGGSSWETSPVENFLLAESCKGAVKFYCGTCTQCRFRWNIWNYEIQVVTGSPLKRLQDSLLLLSSSPRLLLACSYTAEWSLEELHWLGTAVAFPKHWQRWSASSGSHPPLIHSHWGELHSEKLLFLLYFPPCPVSTSLNTWFF